MENLTETQRHRASTAIYAVPIPCGCPDCEDGGRFVWTFHQEPPYLDYICLGHLFDEARDAYRHIEALIAHATATGNATAWLSLPPNYFLG